MSEHLHGLPWRTGASVGRTIYAVSGDGDEHDELIGLMDDTKLAADAVRAHNAELEIVDGETRRPPGAPEPFVDGPSDRGLMGYDRIETSYGHVIRVQDSSAAEHPCVWLFIDGTAARNERDTTMPGSSSPHLTREQAQRLMWALHDFLEATR